MKRLLLLGLTLTAISTAVVRASDVPFDFEVLQYRAKTLAASPYADRPSRVPESLRRLSYDQYRDVRFNPNSSWWRRERLPFQLQFFHPGFVQSGTVQVSEVVDGKPKLITFDRDLFIYDRIKPGELPPTMGFAGFRMS